MRKIRSIIQSVCMVGGLIGLLMGSGGSLVHAAQNKPGNPVVSGSGVTTWDCIYFGHFWQNDTNLDGVADEKDEKEPIKWRVLSVDGDDAFLLADQVLYVMGDTDDQETIPEWKENPIRTWLNDTFYQSAFSNVEQTAILSQKNDGVTDNVYIPSQTEMITTKYGFSGDMDADVSRIARMTNYAQNRIYIDWTWEYKPAQCYYLRTFHWSDMYSSMVPNEIMQAGNVTDGDGAYYIAFHGVRPVIHVDLSKGGWTNAGEISATTMGTQVSGNYHYFIDNGESVILSYDGKEKEITIPDTLGGYPVRYVNSLKKYYDWENEDSQEEYEGENTVTESIIFPDSVWGIGALEVENLKKVTWGKNIEVIGCNAFCACKQLANITLPDTVKYIGTSAFQMCSGLKEIVVPDSVVHIGVESESGVFELCRNLEKVTLSKSLTEIPDNMFSQCEKLHELVIPNSVVKIGDYAFSGCDSLRTITVSESVKEIGEEAFSLIDNDNFYLVVKKGSETEKFAIRNKLPYAYAVGGTIYNKPETADDDTDDEEDDDENYIPVIPSITGSVQNGQTQMASQAAKPATSDNVNTNATIGTQITNAKLTYQVTNNTQGKQEVAFVGTTNKKAVRVIVPSTITNNGVSYRVTSISNKALLNCKKLKKITIQSKTLTQKFFSKKVFKKLGKNITISVPKSCKKKYTKWLKKAGFKGKVK